MMAQTRPQMMPNGGPPGSLGLASHVSGLPIRLPSFWSYLPKNYANAQVPVQYQQVPGAFYQRPAGAAAGQQLLSFAPRLGIPQYLGSPLQQQAQLSPRLVQLRDARALSQASSVLPQCSSTAQARGTDSPLAAKVPATKVEFLPKAVNVKTPPLTDGAAAATAASGGRATGACSEQTMTSHVYRGPLSSPSRELYTYIMQTEGEEAARRFVQQSLQQDDRLYRQMQQVQLTRRSTAAAAAAAASAAQANTSAAIAASQTVLNASDLERLWQEESRRAHLRQSSDSPRDTSSPFANPNVATLANEVVSKRRQSPFGDGPQPYSRLNDEQKQELLQAARRDSPLLDYDSAASSSPGAAGGSSSRTKVPLYMRRVGQALATAGGGDASTASPAAPSPLPPRITYAGAVGRTTTNIDDIPAQTPHTPQDSEFFSSERSDPDSTNTSLASSDPLEFLKNLKLHESLPSDTEADTIFNPISR